MSRKPAPLALKDADRITLTAIAEGNTPAESRTVKRAKALLMLSEGDQIQSVAASLSMGETSVSDLRKRYQAYGIDCLEDRPRGKSASSGKNDSPAPGTIRLTMQIMGDDGKWIERVVETDMHIRQDQFDTSSAASYMRSAGVVDRAIADISHEGSRAIEQAYMDETAKKAKARGRSDNSKTAE